MIKQFSDVLRSANNYLAKIAIASALEVARISTSKACPSLLGSKLRGVGLVWWVVGGIELLTLNWTPFVGVDKAVANFGRWAIVLNFLWGCFYPHIYIVAEVLSSVKHPAKIILLSDMYALVSAIACASIIVEVLSKNAENEMQARVVDR